MDMVDKRVQIIEAAINLFVQKGFDIVSVQEIAEAAAVAKGTIYLYFPSKDALIDGVFDYCHERNVLSCDAGLEEEPTAIGKLQKRMRNALLWSTVHPEEAVVEQMYLRTPGRGPGSRYTQQARHYQSVDKIIRDGIAAGELKQAPSSLLGEAFFGIGGAYYYFFREHPEAIKDETIWTLCMQMVRDCLLRSNERELE